MKYELKFWHDTGKINFSENQTLSKMGVNDYDYHSLQDLKQMVRCES